MTNAESKVADAILEKPFEVVIGGATYKVAPPSTATLIEVSAEVAKLPQFRIDEEKTILDESLRIAKDCRALGDILAVLILGAKNLTERRRRPKKRLLGFVVEWEDYEVNTKSELGKKILEEVAPNDLSMITATILNQMQFDGFFGYTTSLIEINMIRPTVEVEKPRKKKTTASGQ